MPYLVVEKGKDQGQTVEIAKGRSVFIGRKSDADMHLTDTLASRKHCIVEYRDGDFCVHDNASRNGTFLNGRRVTDSPLSEGDQILVGESLIVFHEVISADDAFLGSVVGGYEILELLGKGGMGRVYKARQLSLDRIVALKVLSKRYSNNSAFIERFRREAMAMAKLGHPSIVAVYDVGEADGLHFISMEYMAGGSVAKQISGGRKIQPEQAVSMMLDIAAGLAYAEEKGVIHRDVKPENMMIDAAGNVKICDLGIALTADEDASRIGVFGSPHYIAPEQAQGRPIDHRADIYALGASFYRILTGKTMFRAPSAREVILKQVKEQPPAIGEIEPSLHPDLCALIMQLVSKNPEERPAGAAKVIEKLRLIKNRMLRPGIPRSRISEQIRHRRRSRMSVVLYVAAAAIAVAAALYVLHLKGLIPL